MAGDHQVIAKDANAALGGTGLGSETGRCDRAIVDVSEQVETNCRLQRNRSLIGEEFAEQYSGIGPRSLTLCAHVRSPRSSIWTLQHGSVYNHSLSFGAAGRAVYF